MSEILEDVLRPVIHEKGLAAAIAASGLGKTCEITHVGISPVPGMSNIQDDELPGVLPLLPVADGAVVNEYQINVSALLKDTHPSISIHGVGFYLADGTLFASYRSATPILEHVKGTTLLIGIDVVMSNIPAGSVVVESTGANLTMGEWVPLTRKINGKPLTEDINLSDADIEGMDKYATKDITINGKPLDGDINLTMEDFGGSGVVGSVVKMAASMPPSLEMMGGQYIKEGVVLEGPKEEYREAFEKLSGKDGRAWHFFRSGESFTRGGDFKGVFAWGDKFILFSRAGSTFYIYSFDPAARSTQLIKMVSGASAPGWPVEADGCWVVSLENNAFLIIPKDNPAGAKTVSSPVGNWGYSHFMRGVSVPGGVLMFGSATGEAAFIGVKAGVLQGITIIKLPGASGIIAAGCSFDDKSGNRVTMLATASGQVYWKGGADLSVTTGWELKWSPSGHTENSVVIVNAVYSAEADVVYFVDRYGTYIAGDARFSSGVVYGHFDFSFDTTLGWSCCDGYIFVQPGSDRTENNFFYRMDKFTREWEVFKHGVTTQLGTAKAIFDTAPVVARNGDVMVHLGTPSFSNSSVSTAHSLLFSYDSVSLAPDPSVKGDVANYLRVK